MFNSRNYLQTKGGAMGTICAPSYTNIFMDHFEKKLIYPFINGFPLIYLRFIDDIFLIWIGNRKVNSTQNTNPLNLNTRYHTQELQT